LRPARRVNLSWDIPGTTFSKAMPDDLVLELQLDRTARWWRSRTTQARRPGAARSAEVAGLLHRGARLARQHREAARAARAVRSVAAEIDRLHGPIGLDIGSKTPAEIAVSIVAEIVAVKNGVLLKQKKEGSSVPTSRAVL